MTKSQTTDQETTPQKKKIAKATSQNKSQGLQKEYQTPNQSKSPKTPKSRQASSIFHSSMKYFESLSKGKKAIPQEEQDFNQTKLKAIENQDIKLFTQEIAYQTITSIIKLGKNKNKTKSQIEEKLRFSLVIFDQRQKRLNLGKSIMNGIKNPDSSQETQNIIQELDMKIEIYERVTDLMRKNRKHFMDKTNDSTKEIVVLMESLQINESQDKFEQSIHNECILERILDVSQSQEQSKYQINQTSIPQFKIDSEQDQVGQIQQKAGTLDLQTVYEDYCDEFVEQIEKRDFDKEYTITQLYKFVQMRQELEIKQDSLKFNVYRLITRAIRNYEDSKANISSILNNLLNFFDY